MDSSVHVFVICEKNGNLERTFSGKEIMDLLKNAKDSNMNLLEINIPCFSFISKNNEHLFWNDKCSNLFFSSVASEFGIYVNAEIIPLGQLKFNESKQKIIENTFIIGLIDWDCAEILDTPIVYTKVSPEMWISSESK